MRDNDFFSEELFRNVVIAKVIVERKLEENVKQVDDDYRTICLTQITLGKIIIRS